MRETQTQQGLSTVMVGYLLGLANELESRGASATDVFRRAGVGNALSNDPFNRFASSLLPDVFRLSIEATHDRHFALSAARAMKATDFHVVGLGFLASSSLLSFCRRLEKFLPVITGAGTIHLEEHDTTYRLVTRPFGRMCPNSQDSWMAFILRLIQYIHSDRFKPIRIDMMHSAPRDGIVFYNDYFGAPVSFGQEACALEFAKEDGRVPLLSGCEELAAIQDIRALDYLTRVSAEDVVARVQMAIIDSLRDDSAVSLEAIASRLKLGARQIHQRLAMNRTNFQTVLDQTRQFLAKQFLRDPKLPITEIAYMLGFTDSANFSRAFRRWTGVSPRSCRNKVLQRVGQHSVHHH